MATVGLMAVEVRVLDLVFGRIDITKLRLSDVELLLETDAQGRGNLQFTPPTPAANDRAAATTASRTRSESSTIKGRYEL